MQWENTIGVRRNFWLMGRRCCPAPISFPPSRVRIPMNALIINNILKLFCLCVVGSGHCDYFVTRLEGTFRMCLRITVCDLWTLALSLSALPQIVINIMRTYRLWNFSRRLLQAPRLSGCFSLSDVYRANFRISCTCRSRTFLHRNIWQVRSRVICFVVKIKKMGLKKTETFLTP